MAITVRKATDFSSRFARIVVMGETGAGKTTLVKTLPSLAETLVVNTKGYEDGDNVLSKESELDIYDVSTVKDWEDFCKEIQKDTKYKFVVIDSLTGLSHISLKHFEALNPDRKGSAVFDMYREHGEFLRDSFLELKKANKHIFMNALTKISNDKIGNGVIVPRVDGNMSTDPLRAWMDGTICLKAYEDGSRKLLLANNGSYACKLRVPEKIPMVLEGSDVSLTKVLNLMGFTFNSKSKEKIDGNKQ